MISKSLNTNPVIDVKATTITAIGDTKPALTAASPRTNAPTMLIDVPIEEGIRISLSFKSSNVIININTANALGKGTIPLSMASEISKVSGIISLIDDFKGKLNKMQFLTTFDKITNHKA